MTAQTFDHVYQALVALVDYAEDRGLIGGEDRAYAANQLLDALQLEADDSFDPLMRVWEEDEVPPLEQILAALLTLKEAKKFLGKHTTCLPVPNVEGTLSLSRKGDCEFVLRPDDTESDDCYIYMIADLYTSHLNLHEYPTFVFRPIGIRPVIRVRY